MRPIIAVLIFLVTQVSIPANAAPEKSLGNAMQSDAGSEIIKHLGKKEAAISDNSKSLSSIRQAVDASTKVQGAPEKSLDNALQADAGREILKHLAMMETTMNDNSKSLSNIRQAVEAVETSAKDEAVPAILKRALQADAGSDLLKILVKTINDISKKQLEMAAAIQSNTEKSRKSRKSRMITCQVGNLYIGETPKRSYSTCQVGVVHIGKVPQNKWTKEFPIKLTGFKKTPNMVAAISRSNFETGMGTGLYVKGEATSPTSAKIMASGIGGEVVYVSATYVACGN